MRGHTIQPSTDVSAEKQPANEATDDQLADEVLVARLGALLKERRAGRFTIEALATRAGVSAGLISQIERGIGNPSFGTLVRLAYALDIPLAALFEGPELAEQQMVLRKADRRRLVVPGDGSHHELLVPAGANRLGMLQTTFPPGFSNLDSPSTHPGEEVVLVTSGVLNAVIGGQSFVLEEGDSIVYEASLPHAWTNPSADSTTVILVSTPPATGSRH